MKRLTFIRSVFVRLALASALAAALQSCTIKRDTDGVSGERLETLAANMVDYMTRSTCMLIADNYSSCCEPGNVLILNGDGRAYNGFGCVFRIECVERNNWKVCSLPEDSLSRSAQYLDFTEKVSFSNDGSRYTVSDIDASYTEYSRYSATFVFLKDAVLYKGKNYYPMFPSEASSIVSREHIADVSFFVDGSLYLRVKVSR